MAEIRRDAPDAIGPDQGDQTTQDDSIQAEAQPVAEAALSPADRNPNKPTSEIGMRTIRVGS